MAQLERILDYDTAVDLITNEIDIYDYERAQDLYDYYAAKGKVALGDEPWGTILSALEDDLFELIDKSPTIGGLKGRGGNFTLFC